MILSNKASYIKELIIKMGQVCGKKSLD